MTYVPLNRAIEALSIHPGDIVYIGSDIRPLMFSCMRNGEEFLPEILIDSLMERVTSSGTLLFPVFNWDFCGGKVFDYKHTPGMTGSLGNSALAFPGFGRTRHPIYSFAVWGKQKEHLCGLDNTRAFGPGSPFQFLHDENAKNLSFGVEWYMTFTFLHHIEQISGKCTYRFHKNFTAPYVDGSGVCESRTYSMFVRDLRWVANPDGLRRLAEGRYIPERIFQNDVSFQLGDFRSIVPLVMEELDTNGGRMLITPSPA